MPACLGSKAHSLPALRRRVRALEHRLLFGRLVNLVRSEPPRARIGFNPSPADTAEAVQRWV